MPNITFRGQQYRDDGAPLDAAGNVQAGGVWINPNYAHEGGILKDTSAARFDLGSIGANGGMQIRPDVTAGTVPPSGGSWGGLDGSSAATPMAGAGGGFSYTDPRMRSDYSAYFKDTAAGDSRAWGGGSLTKMANGSANYQYNGENHLIDANTDIASLAAFSPELAAELRQNYPGQAPAGMAGAGTAGGAAAGQTLQENLGPAGGAGGNYGNPSANPTLNGAEGAITRRMTENLNRNILPGVGYGMQAAGGYGNSRQGVLEANAIRDMNLGLGDSLATMNSTDWNNQQNRNLSRYQGDQGFYSNERRTDLAAVGVGADLYSRGMNGEWDAINQARTAYQPFTGLNSTTTSNQNSGGGAAGAVAGAAGTYQLGRNAGWW